MWHIISLVVIFFEYYKFFEFIMLVECACFMYFSFFLWVAGIADVGSFLPGMFAGFITVKPPPEDYPRGDCADTVICCCFPYTSEEIEEAKEKAKAKASAKGGDGDTDLPGLSAWEQPVAEAKGGDGDTDLYQQMGPSLGALYR